MIKEDIIFDENVRACDGVWFGANSDAVALAAGIQQAIESRVRFVSVVPGAVETVWPWVENTNIDVYARFYIEQVVDDISNIATQINNSFRNGAMGAQLFVRPRDVSGFVDALMPIRDDLFFNKKLFLGLDVSMITMSEWRGVVASAESARVEGIILMYTHDNGDKSDFVGQIVGMLDAWNDEFRGGLHLMFGANLMRIEQVLRLAESMRPELKISVWGGAI